MNKLEGVRTFISALESSPVHCLKPLPSGKRRWPGNGGAAAILIKIKVISVTSKARKMISPFIDICHYRSCSGRAMYKNKILANPCDEMVFECTFDDLAKEIRAQKFMDIGAREMGSEWLYYRDVISRSRL